MLNIKALYDETGIRIGSGKHATSGWINTRCPFCSGHEGYHLGWNLDGEYYNCWRCGFHPTISAISKLAGIGYKDAKLLIQKHTIGKSKRKQKTEFTPPKELDFPKNMTDLEARHRHYLHSRNFNDIEIETKWGIKATGKISDLPWRIIIPITFNNKIVSWQSRDITNLAELKYKSCAKNKEIIHHKNILYGADNAGNKTIIVEGVFDAWRLGYGAVATFGSKVISNQILLLAERFSDVFWLFDPEKKAQENAEENSARLINIGVNSSVIEWKWNANDPAELRPDEVLKIREVLR